ncbi:hypothetical protein NQ498_03835 [Collinsella stercoris]|nr:hypothetical protein [Collinsella stercoris]UEA45108.1 hypothetical protein LK434_08195 [Collinsella stercoris DSM 13279]UWP12370.1 hypothetical protein NQ498_03835 [Collinsella stercoris]
MSKRHNMTPDEAEELFSELDASGVLDPDRAAAREGRAKRRLFMRRTAGATAVAEREAADHERSRARAGKIDPLSEQDPSGSQVGKTISRTAVVVILGVFVFVLGMQIVYGVSRRLNTANLSDRTNSETVEHAMESGVEWGNGFTQFPQDFTVDEASEKTGVVEVSVVDTDSRNELELLSNSQIQASALATNALLNEKINRVVYNVYALVDESGAFRHDSLFGFIPARGARRAMLTFVWTKSQSSVPANIDWELKIIGMDDDLAEAIQEQVNSVSSLTENPGASQAEIDEEQSLFGDV